MKKRRKLKILAASDLHEDRKAVERLAEKAEKENVDLVILCGDVTYFDNEWRGMIGPFLKRGKEVFFVPGNHESIATTELLTEKYDITNLQNYSINIGDVGFFGCGGANVGPNIMSERDIHDYLKRNFRYVKKAKKKIMITHVHPTNGMVEKMSFEGSKAVRKAIDEFQPDVHIFGHIHETEGLEENFGKTRSICVGKQGKIISL